MDEDFGAKVAPVTRLRRRLSVEPEDSPHPTTPSTPTKKRSTRLAAKPQLDLIDEVATDSLSKRSTRKAAVKDAETDAVTPTPVTPSRRSTRIRSNTSILSETITQTIDSPRAKRALRRTSQLGSDTESTALTPARQTRKTRKDSTTNVDKQENVVTTATSKTNGETIVESLKDITETSKENETSSSKTRKSPRLNKTPKNGDSIDESEKTLDNSKQEINNPSPTDITTNTNLNESQNKSDSASPNENLFSPLNNYSSDAKYNALHNSTSNKKKVTDDLNTKKNRTKSMTTLASPVVGSSGDNESTKEKLLNTSVSVSDDILFNNQFINTSAKVVPDIKSPIKSMNKSKSSLFDNIAENKENLNSHMLLTKCEINNSETVKLFEKSPGDQNLMVLMEDSDSSCDKHRTDIQIEGEDQCVPIGKPQNESPAKFSQGVEPMDIDESVLANATFDDFSDKSTDSRDVKEESVKSERKKRVSVSDKIMLAEDNTNKPKRKSSVSIPLDINNDSINKSKTNKSSLEKNNDSKIIKSNKQFSHDDDELDGNQSRKSLALLNVENEQKFNQTAERLRNSSISLNVSEANQSKVESKKSINKSQRKSSVSNDDDNNIKLDESLKKSERKSSISFHISSGNNDSKTFVENSSRKSSISTNDENIEKLNESLKLPRRKSSISDDIPHRNDSFIKSERKSSISESIRKSIKGDNNDSNILNKSKTNSLLQPDPLEQSGNENKSTLVISELKDVSSGTNAAMSPNVTKDEFSKSLNGPEIKNKGIDKKNLSMNCLTSTPIQQKSLHKVAMQINTSVISPAVNKSEVMEKTHTKDICDSYTPENIKPRNKFDLSSKKSNVTSCSVDLSDSESKKDSSKRSKKLIKKSPTKPQPAHESSKSSNDESEISNGKNLKDKDQKNMSLGDSSDSDNSNEVTRDKNEMIDDEASEASDDYQSGDSQDEEDRRYAAENEIVDKGETLDSDEDLSNDSDYEKNSFIVSSDGEDGEMLSGTGDDLSMSDNELTMSAKSKKKFNDRKIKEQKKSSREMYEARHKNDASADSTTENAKSVKTKKFNRQRLESSTLESDNEKPIKKRLRIDSSQDITNDESIGIKQKYKRLSASVCENQTSYDKENMSHVDVEEFIGIKKKKSKRLSESVSEDLIVNEKDISIKKVDPDESLVIGNKKKKSKRLSESMSHENTINEKEITLNQSNVEKNDPLSTAIKQEPKTPQKFDMSTVAINEDVEEIQVNANASIIKQIETTDPLQDSMSADSENESSSSDGGEFLQNYDSVLSNLSKHSMKKIKTLDASLNLNKKAKTSKNPVIDQLNLTQTKTPKKNKKDKSVELPVKVTTEDSEQSSDSIDMKLLFPEDSNDSDIHASQVKPVEPTDFIPLKRTEAKTNILEKKDKSISLNMSLNVSKKDKNRKLSLCATEEPPIKPEDNEQMDTEIKIIIDNTGTHQEFDESQSISSKKKNKNKSFNESKANTEEIDCTDGISKTPIFSSEKKKKNKKSKDISTNIENSYVEENHGDKTMKQPKNSKFADTPIENTDETIIQETPANVSIKSDKKKNKKADISLTTEQVTELSTSATKKSKKSIAEEVPEPVHNIEPEITETDISITKEKKKKKNKKNKNLEVSQIIMDSAAEDSDEAPMEVSYKTQKKLDTIDDTHLFEGHDKGSTNRKRKTSNNLPVAPETEDSDEAPMEVSYKTQKKLDTIDDTHLFEGHDKGSTNRKRKTSNNLPVAPENAALMQNEKKKPKNDQYLDNDCIAAYDVEQSSGDGHSKRSKKNKKSKQQDHVVEEEIENKPKKRKNRHDDSQEKIISKVPKQSLFDEVHVPTLPDSVLNQLADKPTEVEKKRSKSSKKNVTKAISTAPFIVEAVGKRKNRPSNYLEQSVYLNESYDKEKKSKPKQRNPKVLPFTPTALTSESGYTSKFNINVLPNETQFVAQSSNVQNFKEAYLGNQRIKKMGTFERCKVQRRHKLAKF